MGLEDGRGPVIVVSYPQKVMKAVVLLDYRPAEDHTGSASVVSFSQRSEMDRS